MGFIAIITVLVVACGVLGWLFLRSKTTENALILEKQRLVDQAISDRHYVDRLKSELLTSIQEMTQQSIAGNSQQFLELAKSNFDKDQALSKSSIEKLVNPISEMLAGYQKQLDSIERERHQSFAKIENEIKRVAESTHQLSVSTNSLKSALKRPHVRGRWGEVQLKNCIELAGMSEYADVNFQDAQRIDEKVLVPDMTVRMPGGRVVVVDAKTPIDAFLSSLEATSDEQKFVEMTRHGRQVKEHVRKLATRAYNEAIPDTADFTVMFLPNESFLYAALEVEPDLVEFALQKKVLVATPPTLIGLLKVIRFGWNEARLAENAAKISEAGMELHKRLCDFVQTFVDIGKHLEKARTEYDAAMTRLESRVIVQARRLEKLGAKSAKELPEGLGENQQIHSAEL